MGPPVVSSRTLRASFVLVLVWLAVLPADAAIQPISRVREIGRAAPNTKVTVRAVVTRYRPGRSIYVQDQTGSIFVNTRGADALVPGDVVEINGVADTDEYAPFIDNATYTKVSAGAPPKAVGVSARELADGRHDAELVSVDGTLLQHRAGRQEHALTIRADGVEFDSWVLKELKADLASLPPGSDVRVTGIASMKLDKGKPRGFDLLMRTGGDVVVLRAPSWWTRGRVWTAAVALLGFVSVLFSYVVLLRRQVARQTGIIRDKLRAESELQDQYRQAQKMEAVGRLAGGIAHDFNNIMTVVLGHSEILALELKDHAEMRGSVAEIQHAAERAAALTRQLLAFGRRQKLEAAVVDLNAVARDMVSLFSRVLGGDIEVRADTPTEPVTVATDRAQLEQALLNLAVNARDAMPEGGRLRLSVSRRDLGEGRTAGVMTVADTGTGIAPEARPHIFEPFFTTKDIGRGSGLGLSMVYGFVQQSGGTIHFDSTVGVGTTFELTFPSAPPDGPTDTGAC